MNRRLGFTGHGPGNLRQLVLGDGGSGRAARAAALTRPARSVHLTASDASFVGARPEPRGPIVVHRQPAVAAVDAALAAGRPEVLALPQVRPAVTDAGTVPHHPGDRVEAADAAGLADPLAAGLPAVV
jgi:hypothetical protein